MMVPPDGLTSTQLQKLVDNMESLESCIVEAIIDLDGAYAYVKRADWNLPLRYYGLTSDELRIKALPPPPPQDAIDFDDPKNAYLR